MKADRRVNTSRLSGAVRRLWQGGPQAAGGVAGVGATVAAGPVVGAVVGAAVEQSLGAIHEAFFAKSLTPDERRRAEFVYQEARRRIFNRRAHGDALADWVLADQAGERAASLEILEAGLCHARDQFEERKLKHMGALLAWLFFEPEISAADAHHYLALGARLRYRQLLVIAVLADETIRAGLPDKPWGSSMLWRDMALVMETAELAHEGVIVHEGGVHSGVSYENINPARMMVLLQGSVLYRGMELSSVDRSARDSLIEDLKLVGRVVLE